MVQLETLGGYRSKVAAALTDCYIEWSSRKLQKALCRLKLKNNLKILDGGCGWGRVFPLYLKKKFKITGVEIEGQRLNKLKQYTFFKKSKNIQLVNGDLASIHLSEKFDIIFLWGVLILIKNPHELLQNIQKFLKKNGVLILTVPAKYSLGYFLYKLRGLPKNHYFYKTSDVSNKVQLGFVKRVSCNSVYFTSYFQLIAGLIVFLSPKIMDVIEIALKFLPLPASEVILIYKNKVKTPAN